MEVVQLSEREFSPQIVAIIARAMNPNPEMRYQTAEEMLYDFSHLHENDPRMRKWKRSQRIAAVCFSALLLSNVFVSFVGLKRMQATQENLKLAEYSANALADGDTTEALKLALQAIPEEKGVLVPQAAAEAQLALTNALGVYNLSDGFQVLDSVTLPGAPFAVAASPEGTIKPLQIRKGSEKVKMVRQKYIIPVHIYNAATAGDFYILIQCYA